MNFPSAEGNSVTVNHNHIQSSLYYLSEVEQKGNLFFLHAWQEAKLNPLKPTAGHMCSLRWDNISPCVNSGLDLICWALLNIQSRWVDCGSTWRSEPGVHLSSPHCPPVSVIQPNEVIIEPDTNTHQVSFTVVFTAENLHPITAQEGTPLGKRYLVRMCDVMKFVTLFHTSLPLLSHGRNH